MGGHQECRYGEKTASLVGNSQNLRFITELESEGWIGRRDGGIYLWLSKSAANYDHPVHFCESKEMSHRKRSPMSQLPGVNSN